MAQRRWLAGLLYAVAFLATVVLTLVYAVRIMTAWYGLMDPDVADVDSAAIRRSLVEMVICLAVSLAVMTVSFIDLFLSHSSRYRKELRHDISSGAGISQSRPTPG